MKRECIQKFLSGFFVFCITLSFSFSVFAAGDASTISGDINITSNTGDVSTATGNVYVDQVLMGTTTQMQQLLDKVNTISLQLSNIALRFENLIDYIYILVDNLIRPVNSQSTTTSVTYNTFNGTHTVTYNLFKRQFDSSNYYYFNFSGLLQYYLNTISFNLNVPYSVETTLNDSATTIYIYDGYPVRLFRNTYIIYSYNDSTDVIGVSAEYRYVSFYSLLHMFLQRSLSTYITAHTQYIADTFYKYFNPRIDPNSNWYWYVYNTDTAQMESVNLGALMYDISWYLGQLYVLQSASQSLDNMTDQVEAITDTLEEAETKENAVISSISSGINSFAPDLSDISAFRALSWTSNYLQQVFLALGTYGTVILVGLLLGVCMQFIGYFKYK